MKKKNSQADCIKLGARVGLKFMGRGDNGECVWKCKREHTLYKECNEIRIGYICVKCMNIDYGIEISEEMVLYILERVYNDTFIRGKQKLLEKDDVFLSVSGYGEKSGVIFIYQEPYHLHYIPAFHKKRVTLGKMKRYHQFKVETCRENGLKCLIVPYYVGRDELIGWISSSLDIKIGEDIVKDFNVRFPKMK